MTAVVEPVKAESLQRVPLKSITPSPTNPRGKITNQSVSDLVASIRQHGIVQPLLLRPVKGGRFEIVAGHRRFRAGELAEIEDAPALIREYTDTQVAEIQLVENLQRVDLDPLEEAAGYAALHNRHGYDVAKIASSIGKSTGYIYQKMKLLALCAEARTMLGSGYIDEAVAVMVARLPHKTLQIQAAKEVGGQEPDERMSWRDAKHYIETNFNMKLDGAPFDTKSETLLPKAGSCVACPKRVGNFPDFDEKTMKPNICTDTACFKAKKDAAWTATKSRAEKMGQKILGASEIKKIWPHEGAEHLYSDAYVEVGKAWDQDPKRRPLKDLVKDQEIELFVAQRPSDGKTFTVARRKDAQKALRAAGHEFASAKAQKDAARPKVDIAQTVRARSLVVLISRVGERVAGREATPALLKMMARLVVQSMWHETVKKVALRHDIRPEKGDGFHEVLLDEIERVNAPEAFGLAAEVLFTRLVDGNAEPEKSEEFQSVLRVLQIDYDKLRGEVKEQVMAREKERAEVKAPATKKVTKKK